jgi:hypothetical protein
VRCHAIFDIYLKNSWLFQGAAWLLVEAKLNGLNVLKSLQRFAGLLNCKKIVQIVDTDNV